jgi:hypothetical protein
MILPKWFVRKYSKLGIRKPIKSNSGLDQIPFVFIETDKGVLIRPIKELLSDEALRSNLGFSRVDGMNEKEVAKLINKRTEKEQETPEENAGE